MATSSRLLALCLLMGIVTASRSHPSSWRPDSQVLQDLLGSELSALLLSQSEVTEGSAQSPALPKAGGRNLPLSFMMDEPVRLVPRPFLDLLMRQRKLPVRGRKGSARGCFGIKVDRIGAISGLGC